MPVETKEIFKTMKHIKDVPKLKETLIISKEDDEIHKKCINPETEIILNQNDTLEKEQAKLSSKNSKKLTSQTRKKIDIITNPPMLPIKYEYNSFIKVFYFYNKLFYFSSWNNDLHNSCIELSESKYYFYIYSLYTYIYIYIRLFLIFCYIIFFK